MPLVAHFDRYRMIWIELLHIFSPFITLAHATINACRNSLLGPSESSLIVTEMLRCMTFRSSWRISLLPLSGDVHRSRVQIIQNPVDLLGDLPDHRSGQLDVVIHVVLESRLVSLQRRRRPRIAHLKRSAYAGSPGRHP